MDIPADHLTLRAGRSRAGFFRTPIEIRGLPVALIVAVLVMLPLRSMDGKRTTCWAGGRQF